MRCTYKLKLKPTREQAILLRATISRFAEACEAIKKYATEMEEYSQSGLQQGIYLRLRDEYELGAQVAVLAIKRVVDAYRILRYMPDFSTLACMTYDHRTYRVINELVISLWTLRGRRVIPYEPLVTAMISGEQPASDGNTAKEECPEHANLIPFLCEEIELCDMDDELILNLLYNVHIVDYAYANGMWKSLR